MCRVEVLALGRAEHSGHFFRLGGARAQVGDNGVADNMLAACVTAYVLAPLTDVAAEFQFQIQCLAKARPLKLIVDTDYRQALAFVIDRLSIEGLDYPVIGTRVQ